MEKKVKTKQVKSNITKKQFHKILNKASQPVKKSESDSKST